MADGPIRHPKRRECRTRGGAFSERSSEIGPPSARRRGGARRGRLQRQSSRSRCASWQERTRSPSRQRRESHRHAARHARRRTRPVTGLRRRPGRSVRPRRLTARWFTVSLEASPRETRRARRGRRSTAGSSSLNGILRGRGDEREAGWLLGHQGAVAFRYDVDRLSLDRGRLRIVSVSVSNVSSAAGNRALGEHRLR